MQALDSNISYVILLDVVIGMLYLFNTLLGAILGTTNEGFNFKKLMFGILKAVCIMLIIVGLCYVLNVFVIVINLIEGLEISTSIVTTLELVGVLISIGVDLAKEVLEKVKAFRSLKYVSYEDIQMSDANIVEPAELKG